MNFSNVTDILIAVALVVFVIYRQFTWQLVNNSRLWRMPVIIAIIGVVMIAQTKHLNTATPLDFAIIAGEIIVSLGLGTAMGFMAKFRTRAQKQSDVANREGTAVADPSITVIESRTGALGAALWIVLIAIRVGIEIVVTHYFPSAILASTGTILLVVAANRAARAFIMMQRVERSGLNRPATPRSMMVL